MRGSKGDVQTCSELIDQRQSGALGGRSPSLEQGGTPVILNSSSQDNLSCSYKQLKMNICASQNLLSKGCAELLFLLLTVSIYLECLVEAVKLNA